METLAIILKMLGGLAALAAGFFIYRAGTSAEEKKQMQSTLEVKNEQEKIAAKSTSSADDRSSLLNGDF